MSSRPPESEGSKQARQEFEKAREEAGRYASEASEAVEQRGREELEKAKRGAADKTEQLADAIDRTADELGSPDDTLSGYGHSMASMMRRFAGGLRENDIEDFAGELAGFARRNPGSFLAGSVALGFGLSRFLKATSQRESQYQGRHYGRDEDYAFEDEDYYAEELGAESDESSLGLRSSTTDVGAGLGAQTGERAGERWPEDRESPGVAGSEYQPGATGQPAGGAGGQQPNESGGIHRE
jgi:hypothetical protein